MRAVRGNGGGKNQKGSVVVEFLMVFPAFLVICLFVVEMSLWYVDKHFLRLAAYEAARSFATAGFPEGATGECAAALDGGGATQGTPPSVAAYRTARKKAALKMAAVAVPADDVFRSLGMAAPADALSAFANRDLTPGTLGEFTRALRHLVMRLPMAFAMTHVKACAYDPSDRSVTVTLLYMRKAKMPLVDRAVWVLYLMSRFNAAMSEVGLQGLMQMRLDDFYTGIVPYSPSISQAQARLHDFRKQLRESVSGIIAAGLDLGEGVAILNGSPLMTSMGEAMAHAGADLTTRLANVDAAAARAVDELQSVQDEINHQGRFLTAIAMSVPSMLRLVPMTDTVRVVIPSSDNPDGRWRDGKASFVAKFLDKPGFDGTGWSDWTLGMQTNHGTVK